MDAQYSRLVHFAPALVGTPDSRLVLRRLQGNYRRARDPFEMREVWFGQADARSRCARNVVQFGALAVLHFGLAGRYARLSEILSDQLAHHRLRHSVFLGRADDHDGLEIYRPSS